MTDFSITQKLQDPKVIRRAAKMANEKQIKTMTDFSITEAKKMLKLGERELEEWKKFIKMVKKVIKQK